MFPLSVAYGSIAWVIAFHGEDDAKAARDKLMALPNAVSGFQAAHAELTIEDDFGQSISCKYAPTAILFENLEKSKILQVDHRMHHARIQSEFQKRAQSDASLRAAHGPAILSPMPQMGGAPRNGSGF